MLAPFDEQPGGQVADGGGVQGGRAGEVELLQGLWLLEAGALQAQPQALGLAALDLVLQQQLEKLQIAELILACLQQAHIESVEHAAELEGFELAGQGGGRTHRATSFAAKLSAGWRKPRACSVSGAGRSSWVDFQ